MRGQNRMPTIPKAAKLISRVPVGVGVVLLEVEVAIYVVEHAVAGTKGASRSVQLDRAAVERGVVVPATKE